MTYKRKNRLKAEQYVEQILAGDIVALSQAITIAESTLEEDNQLSGKILDQILPHTGNSIRVGITGVPGVGKSTFIEAIGKYLTGKGCKIAERLELRFVPEKTPLNLPKGETLPPSSGGVGDRKTLSPSFGGVGEVTPRYITANPATYRFIREMRDTLKNNPTEAEKTMWEYLRNKKTGHKIRRQHIIDDFISDFVCLRKKTVIEIDGKIHLKQKEYDALRTQRLNELGYEVIRFTNEEVFANPELVALKVKEKLDAKDDFQSDIETTNIPKEETLSPFSRGFGDRGTLSPSSGGVGEVIPGYITANPATYRFIREMRDTLKNNPTEAEKTMWGYLRNKKTGHKIRRQHIIDNFISDFVCLRKKTVIEIDGKIHLKQKEYDALRTQRLNELGYEVIRFTNEEVFANPELVALKVKEKLDIKDDFQSDMEATNLPKGETLPPSSEVGVGEVTPIDILDYIYAVLHSPGYRSTYKGFFKIDFSRVPYPKDATIFWQLVKLGGEIRQIHLLESPKVEEYITSYPKDGDNIITTKIGEKDWETTISSLEGQEEVGRIWINEKQYFDNIPLVAWGFYIGGYQPAQKWLKDRRGRTLGFDDILHYQKIIVALAETDRLMNEIDKIEIE